MASTEALDQVVEKTSSLDISNGKEQSSQKSRDPSQEPTKNSASDSVAISKENSSTEAEESKPPATTVKSLPKSFRDNFRLFSKFGDTKSDGKHLTLSQSDKWMKQAKVIDKKITTTDTGIHFKKFKSLKIGLVDYHKFIQSLAQYKNVSERDLIQKMAECGPPGTNISTNSPAQIQDTISRLTDTSRYTGSHKLRFDESGKGKGLAGRKDVAEGAEAGYVHGYQMRNSYDKSH